MEKIIPLFEEYSAGKNKHLLIVDVQKEFEKWMEPNFISKMHGYAKQFPNVYQIWDANSADAPSEEYPNEKIKAAKHYGYDLQKDDIMHYFDKPIQSELLGDFENDDFKDASHKHKGYRTRNGELLLFVGKGHKFYMAEKEILKLMDYLKSLKDGITLCGGAGSECLADIQALLDYYEIPYDLDDNYVYSA